jgi:hypothetical protein
MTAFPSPFGDKSLVLREEMPLFHEFPTRGRPERLAAEGSFR